MPTGGKRKAERDSDVSSNGFHIRASATAVALILLLSFRAGAQTPVLTQHNDISRSGQNTSETVLTTSNVNVNQFGKLFAIPVDGQVYAQPLYVPGVSINGSVHNVLIIATENDSVYAFDADSNTGTNSSPLWKASMVDAAHGAGANETPMYSIPALDCTDLQPQVGITSTPVIDPSSNTIYVEAKSTDGSNYFQRLHALDLLTGNEKSPGPVVITATVDGSGDGSTDGKLPFDALHQMNRDGLLLLNGTIYLGFGSHCDYAPYHGWLMAYDAHTFTQTSVYVTTPNGGLGGMWMGGSGIAADSNGNIYIATGNGDFDTTNVPAKETSDTILKFSTTNQHLTLLDYFTPQDQATLDTKDRDLGSGGVLLLPDQPGTYPHLLMAAGKEGRIYVVNRDQMTTNNSHYCSGCSNDPEIVGESATAAIGGIWGMSAYWNNNIYFLGSNDVLKAIPITNGLPDFSHMTSNSINFSWPGATPSISSNGTTAGTAIVWAVNTSQYGSPGPGPGPAVVYAFDATNISNELWNSSQAPSSRDKAGNAAKFSKPTVVNGKVYVGTSTEIDVYGLLPSGSSPTFTTQPASQIVTVGQTATFSVVATGTAPLTYQWQKNGSNISGATSASYTTPATTSTDNGSTFDVIVTNSAGSATSTSATLTVNSSGTPLVNFGSGFTSTSGLQLNGNATWNQSASRLRLTDAVGTYEASSAFFTTPVNIQSFTNTFSFQLTNPGADGFTFTIQNVTPTALGPNGGGLGYGPDTPGQTPGIASSIAIKFDLYDNAGEGGNSTGEYTNGASPTTPALDMTASGVNLHSGDIMNVQMSYNGTTLSMTVTDATANKTFSTAWTVNIPATAGSNTAYVGFTAGTGGLTAIQEILNWTYSSSGSSTVAPAITTQPANQTVTVGQTATFSVVATGTAPLSYQWQKNGSNISGATSASYTTPATTSTDNGSTFDVIVTNSVGSATSTSATLTVNGSKPTITTQPANQIVTVGQTATFSVVATGTAPLSYQWQKNGSNISGATSASYTTPATTSTDNGSTFDVIVTNSAGSATSTSATLTVNSSGTPLVNFGSGFTSTSGLQLNGNATWNQSASRLRLTDAVGTYEASSAFFTTPVNIQSFTNTFSFQLTNPGADGFTFTIQNVTPTALGPNGGGLGYGPDTPGQTPGIASSIAIKFDLYDNAGEGGNSTGEYTNGASPTTPALDMTASGVNLHSGDIMNVQMSYNGTTLSMTVTDATANKTFSTAWTVNIPATAGSNTAYVGFTAGTGGLTAIQEILNWTYSSSGSSTVAPAITTQPANQTVTVGQTATFSVVATGTAPLSYQWQKNGSNISGATSASYTTPATTSTDNGSTFDVIVTNSAGSATSTSATLTVNGSKPTITTQPANQIVTVGQTATFSVVATGTAPLSYQWQKNGSNISGATSASYTTPATTSTDNGSTFDVIVTNSAGSATSTSATLTVNGSKPTITTQPANQTVTVGQTATFSVVATGTAPLTYQWQKNGSNISGATSASYTTPATTSTDNGSTFDVIVTNSAGSATSTSATLTVNGSKPTITTQPANQIVTVGQTATFSVVATGTAPLTYQWQKNGSNISGATSASYTTPATTSTDNGSTFDVIVTNSAGSATSTSATLTVNSSGTPLVNFGSGFTSTSGLQLNGNATWNQSASRLRLTDAVGTYEASSAFFTTPVNIQSFTNTFSFQLTNPGADGFTFTIQNVTPTALGPNGGGLGYGPDTPGQTPGIASSIAIKFDLYDNAGEGGNSTGEYTNGASPTTPALDMTASGVNLHSGDIMNVQMSYNGTTLSMTVTDATANKTFSTAWTVNIPATAGSNTAYVGFTAGTGGLTAIQEILNWTYSSSGSSTVAPAITTQPANQTVTVGQTATFSVVATGTAPLTYQWQKNGSNISGATSASYTTPATTSTDNGSTFDVIVTNSAGSATSTSATLTVNGSKPTITTQPASQIVTVGQTATFSVVATGTAPLTYQWQKNGSNISGATSASYTTPATTSTDNGSTFDVIVTNSAGSATSTSATLTVNSSGTPLVNFGSGFTSTSGLQLNGNATWNQSASRLRLTDAVGTYEASSAFFTTPVNIQSFTNTFSFQLTNPGADGFTFTIQNVTPTALGPNGGGLGYGPDTPGQTPGIASSIAIKFDLYDNAGEGGNSTGEYTNGASPTTPALDMTASGVNLHSGDIMNVQMSYNGTTLSMTVTDATANKTFSTSWTVNIPATVGSNTAYVGFTAGTGGLTAIQEILNWSYTQ